MTDRDQQELSTPPPAGETAAPPAPAPAARVLTADDILRAPVEVKAVHVPEWTGAVCLRVLPADVGLELNARMQQLTAENKTEALFMLLGATICDQAGAPIFRTDEQLRGLRSLPHTVLARLQREALSLQGWLAGSSEKNA